MATLLPLTLVAVVAASRGFRISLYISRFAIIMLLNRFISEHHFTTLLHFMRIDR